MPKIRKRLAIAVARNFAAGLVENAECALLKTTGLTEDELGEMQSEMYRIAQRIEATVNFDLLEQLGTPEEVAKREFEYMTRNPN